MSAVRDSRAGDDFHLLWAARRALELVDPRSSLQLVRLEGMNPADADDDDDRFLGVDLAEYYGGTSVSDASRIIVSQLKYSVRHPERLWTVARLVAPSSRGGASVFRRLAHVFSGLVAEVDDDVGLVVAKLQIRLVSNQPAATDLLDALACSQAVLEALPLATKTGHMVRRLSPEQAGLITRLQQRSGLSSRLFSALLRVIDLTWSGADPRSLQRIRISQQVGRLIVGPHLHGLPALLELMRSQVLPETAAVAGIKQADVLAALGAASEDDLLPAPSRFDVVTDPIATPDPPGLASMVVRAKSGMAIAHGPAGTGKTTTLLSLEDHLPAGSVVVAYDCFGGGDYLSPGEERHTARRALVQIANEVSLRVGTEPLLLSAITQEADLWRRFVDRLAQAASALDHGALLVVAVDAADNSAFAAARRGDRSFVHDLWDLSLPENVRVLMSCRTHRKEDISPPTGVQEYLLAGFDFSASTALLRRRFPAASPNDGLLFHDRTHGVPRVQTYLLAAEDADDLEELLERSATGLADIFDDVLAAALDERSDRETAQRHLATLFALARPVRLQTLAGALNVSHATARDIAASLEPGVTVIDDLLHFLDEDFEHHLRDRIAESELQGAHSRLSDYFLARRNTDDEAAANIAEHLKEAGRDQELIELALDEPLPNAIHDGLARALVGQRRTRLAIEATTRVNSPEESIKLILLAARLAKSDQSLTSVIRTRPDLAIRFADSEAIESIYMRTESDPWLGPAHLRVASALAWDPATHEAAEEQLTQAHAWVRRWSLLDERDRRLWNMTADDIARGAAAHWGLSGAEAADDFLSRWRPNEVIARAVPTLAQIVASHCSASATARDLRRLRAPVWVQGQFIVAFDTVGEHVSRRWTETVARRLASVSGDHPVFAVGRRPDWGLRFCEIAVRDRVPKRVALALLDRLGAPPPSFAPSDYDSLSHWTEPLRTACLKAALERRRLTVDDLLPHDLRPDPNRQPGQYDPNESKRSSFREALEPHLPIYLARAEGLAGDIGGEELAALVEPSLTRFRSQATSRWFPSRYRYRTWATAAVESIARATGDATTLLAEIIDVAEEVLGRTASLRVELAATLVHRHDYRDVALELLDAAAKELKSQPYPASDRRDIFLDAAAVAVDVDTGIAAELFAQAIDAAQSIDDDVGLHLAVLARLAASHAAEISADRARIVGERFARTTEAVSPFVSDPAEVLPHAQIIATISELDPPRAFALSSRWDDEGRIQLSDSVHIVVRHVCRRGWLPPGIGLRLLRLTADGRAQVDTAISLLDLLHERGPNWRGELTRSVTLTAGWIRRDLPIRERALLAGDLTRWASEHGLADIEATQQLAALSAFAATTPEYQGATAQTAWTADAEPPSTADVSGGLDDVVGNVRLLLDRYAAEEHFVSYFDQVIVGAGPSRRIAALDLVSSLADAFPERGQLVRAVGRALRGAVTRWEGSGRVRTWATGSLPSFTERHLPRLFSIGSTRYGGWTTTVEIPFPPGRDQLPDVLRATAARLDELAAAELLAVVEVSAKLAGPETVAAVVEWDLEQVAPIAPRLTVPDLPQDSSGVLALYLWSALGHPDDRIRWRAAHSARGLLAEDREADLAEALVDLLGTSSLGAFRSDQLDFYWLSARMWALLVLARVAGDAPEVLTKHASRLAEVATDRDLPHAAARELARRAALRLATYRPGLLPESVIEALKFVNRPTTSQATRQHRYEISSEPTFDRDISRFNFDSLDTTRYWYAPLAQVFGIAADEITRRADRWVTDVWGRTTDETYHEGRRQRYEREWHLTHNDHGTRPLIETLRTYLEYHAMLVVAGELVDQGTPVVVEPYDGADDPWDSWLSSHLDTDHGCWLADRRSPTPLEPICFGAVPTRDAFKADERHNYDTLLGLNQSSPERLIVAGWLSTSGDEHYVRLSVASALVSPETALALVRAIQTAPPHRYQLPFASDDNDFDRADIEEPGFHLTGWLDHVETNWSGLDDHDPLASTNADDRTVPVDDFRALHNLTVDPTGTRYHTPAGEEVVSIEIWDDGPGPGERDEIPRASKGRRTWVRTNALLTYLGYRKLDLIIDAHVWMYAKSQSGLGRTEADEKHGYEKSCIYLLRQDGSVESIDGPRQPWNADRQRTRPG